MTSRGAPRSAASSVARFSCGIGAVDPQVTWNLGLACATASFVVHTLAIIALFAYRITQAIHEENLRSPGKAAA